MSVTICKRVPDLTIQQHRAGDLAIVTLVYNPKETRLSMNMDNVGQEDALAILDRASSWINDPLGPETLKVGKPEELAAAVRG